MRQLTLKFVLETGSAFRIVENDAFLELVDYVSFGKARIPTNKMLLSDLKKTYDSMKEKLINLIGQSKYVCLTADVWTKHTRIYMGVTVHLFDSGLNRVSYLLAFRRMYGRHTSISIKEMLLNVIKEFKIKKEKITHIITDGARNFLKAFDKNSQSDETNLNERREGDEQQGAVNDTDDFEIDIDSLLATVDELPTDVVLEQLDFGSIREYAYDDEEDDNETLPKQLRCVAHTLNLIGTDFDKHLKANERNCSDYLEKAHSKLKKNLESKSSFMSHS